MVGGSEAMVIASMWASMAAWFTPTVLFCLMNLIIATIFIANNGNKHHGHDQVHGDSFSRMERVSSLVDRDRSMSLSSNITTVTTSESRHQYPAQPKKATYSSLSRLAQSIHFPSAHGTPRNGGHLSQSESERHPPRQPVPVASLLERVKAIKLSSVHSDNTILTESQQISNSAGQLIRAPSVLDRVKSFKISSALISGAPSTQPENIDTGHNPDHLAIRSKSEKTSAKKSVVEIKKSRSEIRISSDDEEDVDWRRPETARERRNADEEGVDAKADDFITRFRQQLKLQRLESLVRFQEILHRRT